MYQSVKGWHVGGILATTDMPVLISHNRLRNWLPILHIGKNDYGMDYVCLYWYANPDIFGLG